MQIFEMHKTAASIISKLHFASCLFTYSCGSQLHEHKKTFI